MTRLAVLDPTPRSDQPMIRGDNTLVFNGEIYNFRELRVELEDRGHHFITMGDTEVLLVALAEWGVDALPRLHGMFAFAWWSARSATLTLCRDEYGIKPLYWRALTDGEVIFASEARVLADKGSGISRKALQEFLAVGSPISSVAFEDVHELAPGMVMQVRERAISILRGPWLDESRDGCDPSVALSGSVASHMIADRPVALFLSGGFDSALLAAHVTKLDGPKPLAVTLRTADNDEEIGRAARTARHYGLDHVVHNVDVRALPDKVRAYVAAQDQPTLDGLNTYLVSEAARAAGCVVALSGLGGDEVFGGYSYYRAARLARLASSLPQVLRQAGAPVAAAVLRRPVSAVMARLEARSCVERFLASREIFSPAEIARLTGDAPVERLGLQDRPDLTERLQFSRLDFDVYLRATLLRDADVFSMRHGVEVRVPLLDSAFVRAVLHQRMPPTKSELANAIRDPYLSDLAAAPKLTFCLPWHRWLSAIDRDVTRLRLDPRAWRDHLDPAVAREMLESGKRFQSYLRPWSLVVLGLWLEQHVDAQS